MFTNRWKRSEDLEEDEWFIPYKRRSAPQAQLDIPQGGVGEMPNVTSVNMARPTRSFFGSGSGSHGGSGSGSGSGSTHRRQKSTPLEDDPTTRSRFFKRPAFPRSGSDGSLTRPSPLAVPSITSVPTGLAAPKMLFSPMMREIRDDTQPSRHDNKHPPSSYHIPRHRTVSLPKQQTPSHVYDKIDQRRWAAPTMCDMLVFPRPHILPHTITPPASPEKLPSVFDGLSMADKTDRDKERDEWHKYVEKRARGRSFRIGASVNGNTEEKGHGIFNRARSASAGAGPSRKPSRKSDKSKYQDPNSAPPLMTAFNFGKPSRPSRETQHHDDLDDDPFRPMPTEAERYKTAHHQHTKSSPDLSSSNRNRVRVAPRPPWQNDGVIIIGPSSSRSRSGLSNSTTKPDFTKPLPPLPAEYRLQYNPSSPFKPFETRDNSRAPTPTLLPPSRLQHSTEAAPIAGPSRLNNEISAADARAIIAKQHQRAITKRAFNSPRPRQHRDSEVSNSTTSQYSTGSQRASTLSTVSPLRRMTAMEEAITRSRANSASSQTPTALQSSTASRVSAATTVTATPLLRSQMRETDRSTQTTPPMRQVSAESQTPSPRNQNHEDFKASLLI
jgi:hypothetical protein